MRTQTFIAVAAALHARFPVFNGPTKSDGKPWFTVTNEAAKPAAEILIYEQIGKDWWDGSGVGAKDFADALAEIPKDREIEVAINSPGGNVWDGLAIFNQLQARKDKVVCRVDGVAASIASVIAMAGRELRMPKNALLMIHDPMTVASGNVADMNAAIKMLNQVKASLVSAYEGKTKKSAEEIGAAMSAETWYTADEAKQFGFADKVTDAVSITNTFDLSSFRRVPDALRKHASATNGGANTLTNTMNKKIIALLRKHGIQVADDATDAQLEALLETLPETVKASLNAASAKAKADADAKAKADADAKAKADADASVPSADAKVVALQSRLDAINAQLEGERKTRITSEVKALSEAGHIPTAQLEDWTARAIKDETVIAAIRALPVHQPGGEPVTASLEVIGEDPKSIEKGIMANWGGNKILTPEQARERGQVRAQIIAKNYDRIAPVLNTNTIGADLKRVVILQQMIRAFATRLLPLSAFSTSLGQVLLQGTDEIIVPYFALDTTASDDFEAATGYDVIGNTSASSKKVTINKRKYQGLSWTSSELRRQPFLDVAKGAMLKVEQLGKDVVNDVLSIITAANFGYALRPDGSNFIEPASSFDSDDVIDLRTAADDLDWPDAGRSLILGSAYDNSLFKDSAVKSATNWGDSTPIREGWITQIQGFDYYRNSHIPANAEYLAGFMAYMSAILFGQASIQPTAEVMQQLTRYEVVVEPSSGASIEYRLWGNPVLDSSTEVIECNYGYAKGEAAALKRITTQ